MRVESRSGIPGREVNIRTLRKNCQHHWMCERQNGPTSRAECKFCGKKSKFNNSVEDNIESSMSLMLTRHRRDPTRSAQIIETGQDNELLGDI